MKSQCNFIPELIWVREIKNGTRHITLRKNFVEFTVEDEIRYEYDETDIYIPDRENITEYVNKNFDTLFELGLADENKPIPLTIEERVTTTENKVVSIEETLDTVFGGTV